MSWWKRYTAGGTGNTSSSSSSSSSNQGDDNKGGSKGGGVDASTFGTSYTSSKGNADEAGGSTVVNNNNDNKKPNTSVYEDAANQGYMGAGYTPPEERRKTSGFNPDDNKGGTMTETDNDGTVTTTTNVLGNNETDAQTVTITPPEENNNNTDGEDDIFTTLFGDENTTDLPDDAKKNTTMEEKRALVLKFKAQSGYDQLPTSLRNEADKIIAKINAGEYFGSDFANMQGTTQTGNEILAGNNKSVSDISAKDALNLFRIATQNKNAGTAREAGFSSTAEALLKSYVESLSPSDKAAFQAEAQKIKDTKFTDPRANVLNMFKDPLLLRRLTGLSTLNENQLAYDQFVNEAQRVRDSRSDNNTGQVNTFTSSQMGTDTTEQGETSGYGTLIGSDTATGDFIDSDGDGVDDRYQSGPNQPYEGPDRDPNKTTTPDPDVTTNPSSFGNTALSGVYDMIPVKNRFTGKIEYIRRPVRSNTGTRNFGSIYI
jgi:hypothetical protein